MPKLESQSLYRRQRKKVWQHALLGHHLVDIDLQLTTAKEPLISILQPSLQSGVWKPEAKSTASILPRSTFDYTGSQPKSKQKMLEVPCFTESQLWQPCCSSVCGCLGVGVGDRIQVRLWSRLRKLSKNNEHCDQFSSIN